jgi:hypothetical protein
VTNDIVPLAKMFKKPMPRYHAKRNSSKNQRSAHPPSPHLPDDVVGLMVMITI